MNQLNKILSTIFLPFCIGLMFVACTEVETTNEYILRGDRGSRGTASATITEDLAISDGIYLWLKVSANTQKFYAILYEINISNWSDAEIIADARENGQEWTKDISELYWWNLSPNTNYTYCVVAIDAKGNVGRLTKKTIRTKSANNQPSTNITISNISSGTVYFNVTKNNYCSWFVETLFYNLSTEDIDEPDIYWAASVYSYRNNSDYVKNTNITNGSWTPTNKGWCAIVTLGFTSNNEYGGVISKKIFNSNTGTIYGAALFSSANHRENAINYFQNGKGLNISQIPVIPSSSD
jgi:hypothetical protein